VGSLAGQIGKILGRRVVGIAGTDEKCSWLSSLRSTPIANELHGASLPPRR